MEFERSMRSINREVINPEIKELTIDGLRPVIRLIAQARARYLKALFELGDERPGQVPDKQQLEELSRLRHAYEEMAQAAQALETAIQRGYLDVRPSAR
jgi:hypothetical protein